MIANKLTILTATAALLEPALALGHRHAHHQHAQKRDWITATIDGQVVSWENNYFGPGGAPAATQAASRPEVPAAPAPAAAQPTTIIKVAKPSQAAKAASKPSAAAYEAPEAKQEAAPKKVKQVKAASTPKKTTTSSSSSGGSAGFSHKRGVCYNDVKMANTFAANCKNCGWGYNWDSESGGLEGVNFIPTLWSADSVHVDRFPGNCAKALANGAKAIFSFNEPDNAGQAHMSPADAAKAHVKLLNSYAGKALIGAPSISNSGLPGEGREWLSSFVDECDKLGGEKCHYDFCNIHWYSEVEYGETLFEHIKKSSEICGGKPIWLTEFAPTGSDEAIASWLEETIPRLESLDILDAYSYFKVDKGMLMTTETEMSTYGS
ncbi:hypothetical protein ACLX1H_002319 [Fusarium chlamydosporum]